MSLANALAAYLSELWRTQVAVANLARIPGGASRETYRFDAVTNGATRGLILRRDPVGSLIDTDRAIEFAAYRSFHGIVPVPEPVVLEPQGGPLERPFFIMGRIDGGIVAAPIRSNPYGVHAAAIGEALFSLLGEIARTPVDTLPLRQHLPLPAPTDCWRQALDLWEAVIRRDELHPQPIVHAALRRLRRNPPPPAQRISVVHGDYRSGNFLHDGQGRIIAVLDWEMAHFGDPLEDLAWCIDPVWGHDDATRVAGTLPLSTAVAVWERASGLTADPAALAWWRLFNAVKGQAIWTTAGKTFSDSGGSDVGLGFSSAYLSRRHDRIIADSLAQRVEEGWR